MDCDPAGRLVYAPLNSISQAFCQKPVICMCVAAAQPCAAADPSRRFSELRSCDDSRGSIDVYCAESATIPPARQSLKANVRLHSPCWESIARPSASPIFTDRLQKAFVRGGDAIGFCDKAPMRAPGAQEFRVGCLPNVRGGALGGILLMPLIGFVVSGCQTLDDGSVMP